VGPHLTGKDVVYISSKIKLAIKKFKKKWKKNY
jgi:hypothetical protein